MIARDSIRVIQEAGRMHRETGIREDFELYGLVTRLERDPGADLGRVTISGLVDGKPRRIGVLLPTADYDLAGRAHQFDVPVVCAGELAREGQSYVLRDPRHFDLDPEFCEEYGLTDRADGADGPAP